MRQRWRLSYRLISSNSEQSEHSYSISPAVTHVYQGQERWRLESHTQQSCQPSMTYLQLPLGCQPKDGATHTCSSRRWLSQTGQHRPNSASPGNVLTWKQGDKMGINMPVSAGLPSSAAQCALSLGETSGCLVLLHCGNTHSWRGA